MEGTSEYHFRQSVCLYDLSIHLCVHLTSGLDSEIEIDVGYLLGFVFYCATCRFVDTTEQSEIFPTTGYRYFSEFSLYVFLWQDWKRNKKSLELLPEEEDGIEFNNWYCVKKNGTRCVWLEQT